MQPNFKLGIQLVRVQVAVTDRSGSVPDLAINDFEILEDGEVQSIQHVELLKWRMPRGGRERQRAGRRATEEQPRPDTSATIDVPLPGVSGAYYVVVFNSDAPIDGRVHVLEVRVKRPGASVRAPAGYRADGIPSEMQFR